jgi:hypothetical protein
MPRSYQGHLRVHFREKNISRSWLVVLEELREPGPLTKESEALYRSQVSVGVSNLAC